MSKIVFFRQSRADGGVRTGLDIDEETILQRFEDGTGEVDPVLTWFVDLRCEGVSLPHETEKAYQWLLAHSTVITDGFLALANVLDLGLDTDVYPLSWDIPNPPAGVRMSIVCSAMRKSSGRRMKSILREVAEHWVEYVDELYRAEVSP